MNKDQFQRFLLSNDKSTHDAIETHVNGKIDAMGIQLKEHAIADLKYQEKIDGNIQWVVRLIIGAVILGVIATILK